MKVKVEIFDNSTGHWIPDGELCRTWIKQTLHGASQVNPVTVSLCFVDADESEQLNRRYRDRHNPANVLSFPYGMPTALRGKLDSEPIGDIVVCAELAQREAQAQGKPVDQHWAHLVIHGCLHLLGFDHLGEDEAERMEKMEIEILRNLGIPNPYVSSM